MTNFFEVLAQSPAALISTAALLGLMVGSFLNVVIYRLPVMLQRDWRAQALEVLELPADPDQPRFNLMLPASRCGCGAPIRAWHNLPVLGWLLLRGRARCCGARISARYPLVEALTAALSGFCAWKFGYSPALVASLLMTWVLVAATFIDWDTQLLPDDLTMPLLWAGLLFAAIGAGFAGVSLPDAVFGAIAGYLSLWLVYWGFKLATGKEGMGYGDFKLLGALGAWLGWQALPQIILLSSVVGALIGISLMLTKQMKQGQAMPFGPYLAVAGWLSMIGVDVLGWLQP